MAQSTQQVEAEDVIDESLVEANNQRAENQTHEGLAEENGGHKSYCEEGTDTYGDFELRQQNYSRFVNQNTQALNIQIRNLNDQGSNLLSQQDAYFDEHGDFVDPAAPIDDRFNEAKKRLRDAQAALANANKEVTMAQAEQAAAQAACDDDTYCSAAERERIRKANARVAASLRSQIEAQREYNAANSDMRYRAAGRTRDAAPGAMQDITDNANGMAGSHSISGCGGSSDITQNTSQDCTLSGPLYEQDQELNRIAMAGINEAQQLAAQAADDLFDLELQQEYAADYKLYQLAVAGGFTKVHQDRDIASLDEVDGLREDDPLKTKNLKLTISNIKTVALASAAVKDTVCEQHDESEVDSKAVYIFKAAAATWMMAVVQDTDFFAAESTCKSSEMLTGDDKNLQIQTIERAANVKDQMLENVCMRVTPPEPGVPYSDWPKYADTQEQGEAFIDVINGYTDGGITYKPLKERCADYLEELRGPEYRDAPRTREQALIMMKEAEALALQELMSKSEKLRIADANVKKGEQWVKDVQRRIMIALALAAALEAAKQVAAGVCSGCSPFCGACCSQCPVAAQLGIQLAYVMGTLYGVYLLSELARAKAFLKKWKEKYRIAQYYTHVACNYETAYKEEKRMAELGDAAQKRKEKEVQDAIDEATQRINNDVKDAINDTLKDNKTQTYFIDKLNKDIKGIDSQEELLTFFSKKVFKTPVKSMSDLTSRLTRMGIDMLTDMAMSKAHAGDEVLDKFTTKDKPDSAQTATRDQKRNIHSNTNALNIQEGTESFRYFLVQRNTQFQNQTNDVTNQPNHTRDNTAIGNAGGSNVKNFDNAVMASVENLASEHLATMPIDVIKIIPENGRTGFPTPETRLVTIQNAIKIFEENLNLLNGGMAELAWQRDQTVQLLRDMRRRMSLNDVGLGETQLIPGISPKPVCMVGDVSKMNFDPTCGCASKGSCSTFEFPKFDPLTPNALRNGGRLSTTVASDLMSGNLSGAALNGGRLQANAAAVRKDLMDMERKIDKQNGLSPGSTRDAINQVADRLSKTSEDRVTKNLKGVGIDRQNSPFSRARAALLNSDLGKESNAAKTSELSDKDKKNLRRGRGIASLSGKVGSDKDKKKTESFSLGNGSGNLNLAGLSDEERARLGLTGEGAGSNGKNGGSSQGDEDRYGHVRANYDENGRRGSRNKNDPFYGINKDRKGSIFKIISKRYEKTAFPMLLDF